MTFAEKLIVLRKKDGLSQEDIAEKLDVTRQAVYKWENEQSMPDIEKIKTLSKMFNVSIDNLLDSKQDIIYKNDTAQAKKFGEVFTTGISPQSVNPEVANSVRTSEQERLLTTRRGILALCIIFSAIPFFSIFVVTSNLLNDQSATLNDLENWGTQIITAFIFAFGFAIAYKVLKESLFLVRIYERTYFFQQKKKEESKMYSKGYYYVMLQNDRLAWFFYDGEKKAFGFYFDGKEQLVCPLQNYHDYTCVMTGGGITEGEGTLGTGIMLGEANGVGVYSSPTYNYYAPTNFDFCLTYFDENGKPQEYSFRLNSTREYVMEEFKNAEDMWAISSNSISASTKEGYQKVKTKLDMEKTNQNQK